MCDSATPPGYRVLFIVLIALGAKYRKVSQQESVLYLTSVISFSDGDMFVTVYWFLSV